MQGGKRKKGEGASSKKVKVDHYEEIWTTIQNYRRENEAPVDTMGCDVACDDRADKKTQRYQLLVSLMLSSQTKDETNAKAMTKLKAHGLTVENILRTSEADLNALIREVGFHNKKAGYIKLATEICHREYDGDIPRDYDDIVKLKGVGPKMAYLLLHSAWDDPQGIGVDVHVHRIANRLQWVGNTKNPEETRKELQSWLPKGRWREINTMLVGFGQTMCKAQPLCDACPVSHLCPSSLAVA